jgi:hypothetical protein
MSFFRKKKWGQNEPNYGSKVSVCLSTLGERALSVEFPFEFLVSASAFMPGEGCESLAVRLLAACKLYANEIAGISGRRDKAVHCPQLSSGCRQSPKPSARIRRGNSSSIVAIRPPCFRPIFWENCHKEFLYEAHIFFPFSLPMLHFTDHSFHNKAFTIISISISSPFQNLVNPPFLPNGRPNRVLVTWNSVFVVSATGMAPKWKTGNLVVGVKPE